MSSIYDLKHDGIRKQLYAFHETYYGRMVFFLAYFIPFVLFISAALVALFALFFSFDMTLLIIAGALIVAFVPAFIVGNMYFYSELRKFVNHRDRDARRSAHKK